MPAPRSDPHSKHKAIALRHNMTHSENALWIKLRNDQLGVSFRRQHAIGTFITDFCCIKKKIIIELDGENHLDQVEYDTERTIYLESRGYKVIRFWDRDVMQNIKAVVEEIASNLDYAPA